MSWDATRAEAPAAAQDEAGTWLPISDLMSVLLLLFVLLFVSFLNLSRAESEAASGEADAAAKAAAEAAGEDMSAEAQRRLVIGALVDALERGDAEVKLNPETGDVSLPERILFDEGSAVLKPGGRTHLDQIVPPITAALFGHQTAPGVVPYLVVEGHTSSKGSWAFNQQLSLDRASSVARYVMEKSGAREQGARLAERLIVSGHGEAEATQDEDRPEERRVLFRLYFRSRGAADTPYR